MLICYCDVSYLFIFLAFGLLLVLLAFSWVDRTAFCFWALVICPEVCCGCYSVLMRVIFFNSSFCGFSGLLSLRFFCVFGNESISVLLLFCGDVYDSLLFFWGCCLV